ncbi:hypothetical protein D3C72_640450 [compost metagenome]
MPELDAVALARLPAGKRTFELRVAFIDLEVALLAQHGCCLGLFQEWLQLDLRQIHQRRLGGGGMFHLRGGTGPPEPEHPRRDLQRIGGRHAERTERIEQPFRRFPENAGRCKWQDIGEGKGAGIAG